MARTDRQKAVRRAYRRRLAGEGRVETGRKRKRGPGQNKRRNVKMQRKQREARARVLAMFGDRCVRCGFGDLRALQIDHVHADGSDHKRRSRNAIHRNHAYYWGVLQSLRRGEDRYQVLCANCNWIKRDEEGSYGGTGARERRAARLGLVVDEPQERLFA